MAEFTVDPIPLLRSLSEQRVAFVLIGGVAAIAHGAVRPTYDVDVTPERSEANLDRLAKALAELDARIRVADEPDGVPFVIDARTLAANSIWNLVTRLGDLDISFEPSGTTGYTDLVASAERLELADGLLITVASLDDVIRSKQAAARPKDLAALPELRALQEGD